MVQGDVTFKKVAYELLAEKGYQDEFIPYVSNKYGEEALRNGMVTYSSWFEKDVGLITETMVLNKVFGNQYATQTDFRKALFIVKLSKANLLIGIYFTEGNLKNIKVTNMWLLKIMDICLD